MERNVSAKQLLYTFVQYGPIPRVCFHLAGDEARTELYDRELRAEIAEYSDFTKPLQTLGIRDNTNGPSDAIMMIVPNTQRLPSSTFVSRYVALLAAQRSPGVSGEVGSLHTMLAAIPASLSGAQYTYEARIIDCAGDKHTWNQQYQSITSNARFGLQFGGHKVRYASTSPLDQIKEGELYVFDTGYVSTYRAILISKDSHKWVHLVNFLYPGTDMACPIRLAEIQELVERMPQKWRPRPGGLEWDILYFVPLKAKETFRAQSYISAGSKSWGAEMFIQQYVSGWDVY